MKKKKVRNLNLNKKSISHLQADLVKGEGTLCLTELCIPISPILTYLRSCYDCTDTCLGVCPGTVP